jgi:hypothetical protein
MNKFKTQQEVLNILSTKNESQGIEIDISNIKTRQIIERLREKDLVYVRGYKENIFAESKWFVFKHYPN